MTSSKRPLRASLPFLLLFLFLGVALSAPAQAREEKPSVAHTTLEVTGMT